MIDRSLNFGRHLVHDFLASAGNFSSVLDLGAGYGEDLLAAKKVNSQAKLHAIELFPDNIEILSVRGISVHRANIEHDRLPFADDQHDIIIANQILEHTKEIFFIFHEISRVLKTGGRLIVGVPNLASLHNRLLLLVGRQPSSLKSASAHIRGFTKPDILNFLEDCFPGGYKHVAFGGSNFYPFPPAIARFLARCLPSMAWGIFLVFEKQKKYCREFLDFPINRGLATNFHLGWQGDSQSPEKQPFSFFDMGQKK